MLIQKLVKLKGSWISVFLWFVIATLSAGLLQLYWMPVMWRISILSIIGLVIAFSLFHTMYQAVQKISINEQGAFLCKKGCFIRLEFVRANNIQLIAKIHRKQRLVDLIWPAYKVIYRDSVSRDDYQLLRSFAAQQILLRRSEEARKYYN